MKSLTPPLLSMLVAFSVVGTAGAAFIDVTDDIATDRTWSPDNTYFLQNPIYVTDGASLTIEAGTVVITEPQYDGGIVVTRGSQIFVNGTAEAPVVMTSARDVTTWDGSAWNGDPNSALPEDPNDWDPSKLLEITEVGDPSTGEWAEAANEWRNLTILGRAVISASEFGEDDEHFRIGPATDGDEYNPIIVDGTAQKDMEGLTADPNDPDEIRYGGPDDDDDSGSIHYLSSRYTGRVLGAGNELNGLSLGAIGRETEIDHVDLMNNIDDGFEIWGGTVNIKYANIWNIGDDSFDIDEGWRGKAQFGLIVQGWSVENPAKQGSGLGDNCFETDGAEQSDVQPVTTGVIYNFTVIGQPGFWADPNDPNQVDIEGGDNATEWRDNARVQYHNCIFMDIGDNVIKGPKRDGDGGQGYGFDESTGEASHTWAEMWNTSYDTYPDWNVATDPNFAPAKLYQAQASGKVAQMTDCVFYNIQAPGAWGAATDPNVDILDPNNHNVQATVSPIKSITRDSIKIKAGKAMFQVIELDPRGQNDALDPNIATDPNRYAPADGFFTPAPFRGAFSDKVNWLVGWTACDAYGFLTGPANEPDPETSIELTKVETDTTFETEAGVFYTIEKSDDMRTWIPVTTVIGTGDPMSVTDLDDFDAATFYRAIAQ